MQQEKTATCGGCSRKATQKKQDKPLVGRQINGAINPLLSIFPTHRLDDPAFKKHLQGGK